MQALTLEGFKLTERRPKNEVKNSGLNPVTAVIHIHLPSVIPILFVIVLFRVVPLVIIVLVVVLAFVVCVIVVALFAVVAVLFFSLVTVVVAWLLLLSPLRGAAALEPCCADHRRGKTDNY